MPTKEFKTKEEAKLWVISKVKSMLNKKYNEAIGITIAIKKYEKWNATVALNYTDDSAKTLKLLVPKRKIKLK